MAAATKAATTVRFTQVRSAIGSSPKQVSTLAALGLGRIGKRGERADNPQLRGQLRIVSHLVETEEAS